MPVERPLPQAAAGEVLIKVAAAGVNRPDVLQRRGSIRRRPARPTSRASKSPAPSRRSAPASRGWRVGDAVCALVAGGGYAEYCVAPAPQCLPVPARHRPHRGGGDSRNVLHRLDQRLRARTPEGGRVDSGPRRIERHRHDGHSAGARARRARLRHRRIAGEVRGLRARSAPSARSTTARADFVAAVTRARPAGAASTSCSTWSGGDYLAAQHRRAGDGGPAGRRSRTLGGAKAEINIVPIMQRRLTITGSTLRPRSVAEKGAHRRPPCASTSGRSSSRARSSRSCTRRFRCATPPRRTA